MTGSEILISHINVNLEISQNDSLNIHCDHTLLLCNNDDNLKQLARNYVSVRKLVLKSSGEIRKSFVFFATINEHSILQPLNNTTISDIIAICVNKSNTALRSRALFAAAHQILWRRDVIKLTGSV